MIFEMELHTIRFLNVYFFTMYFKLIVNFCIFVPFIARFGEIHEWSNKPTVKVAVTVDAPRVMKLVMDRLLDSWSSHEAFKKLFSLSFLYLCFVALELYLEFHFNFSVKGKFLLLHWLNFHLTSNYNIWAALVSYLLNSSYIISSSFVQTVNNSTNQID